MAEPSARPAITDRLLRQRGRVNVKTKKTKMWKGKKKLNFCKNQPGQKISARPGEVVTMSRMVIRLTEKWKIFFFEKLVKMGPMKSNGCLLGKASQLKLTSFIEEWMSSMWIGSLYKNGPTQHICLSDVHSSTYFSTKLLRIFFWHHSTWANQFSTINIYTLLKSWESWSMKVRVMLIVVGVLKNLEKSLRKLEIRGSIETIVITALLKSARKKLESRRPAITYTSVKTYE